MFTHMHTYIGSWVYVYNVIDMDVVVDLEPFVCMVSGHAADANAGFCD